MSKKKCTNEFCPVGCPESHDALHAVPVAPALAALGRGPKRAARVGTQHKTCLFRVSLELADGAGVIYKFRATEDEAGALGSKLTAFVSNGQIRWHLIEPVSVHSVPALEPLTYFQVQIAVARSAARSGETPGPIAHQVATTALAMAAHA